MIDPPNKLPVDLSVSSLSLLWKCPEKWRRRYIALEYEPPSGAMIAGSALGAAEGQNFQQKIETETDLPPEDILDLYSDEFDLRVEQEEDVVWGEKKPGNVKDAGADALAVYHDIIVPKVKPISVERKFEIGWDGLDWTFRGYIDVEDASGDLIDLKLKGKKLSEADAHADPQPTGYLLARAYEGTPADNFIFHVAQTGRTPSAYPVPTTRTDRQLDAFVQRIFAGAAEIHWRMENDVWDGAPPGAWWCGERYCGFWSSCPHGGLR